MKFIYEGNRDATNTATGIYYHGQGTAHDEGAEPVIHVGEAIDLSDSEHARLDAWLIFTDAAEEGTTPPSVSPPVAAENPDSTSGTGGSLEVQSSPSATSKKS